MADNLKNILNYIPIILILGILCGFGAHTTLLGALIITIVFGLFKKNCPFIFGATVVFALTLASCGVFLGGGSETLFALLFITSVIAIIFSFVYKKNPLEIPRPVLKGVAAGIYLCAPVLCIPLIFGQKTFSAIHLMLNMKESVFAFVNENAVVCAFAVFAGYYYLSKVKIKFLPAEFCAVLIGCLVNFVCKLGLDCANAGFKGFSPVVSGNFGSFGGLLFFGLLVSVVMIIQTSLVLRTGRHSGSAKEVILYTGISNAVSSISGSIAGLPVKKASAGAVFEAAILFVFVLFFDKIAAVIPVSAIGAILFIKAYEKTGAYIKSQKACRPLSKTVFYLCALVTFFSIPFGLIFSFALALAGKKLAQSR